MKDIKALIDIGSNSVRIALFSDGTIFLKRVNNTQLGKEKKDGFLNSSSMERTFEGIEQFIELAKENGTQKFYAFATAAVRNAINGKDFCNKFYEKFGFEIDLLSGEREAETGLRGALWEENGTVIDVGGASTEIVTRKNGKIAYSHSLQEGAVSLTDMFKKDIEGAKNHLLSRFKEYKNVQSDSFAVAIGGSATTLAFIKSGQREYNEKYTNNAVLTLDDVKNLTDELYSLLPCEIVDKYNIKKERSEVIHSGALILLSVMEMLALKQITVRESDNLEGYYFLNLEDKS